MTGALELVSDRETKKPADKATTGKVADAAYVVGVMLRISGSNIILSPPLILSADEVRKIGEALNAGLAQIG